MIRFFFLYLIKVTTPLCYNPGLFHEAGISLNYFFCNNFYHSNLDLFSRRHSEFKCKSIRITQSNIIIHLDLCPWPPHAVYWPETMRCRILKCLVALRRPAQRHDTSVEHFHFTSHVHLSHQCCGWSTFWIWAWCGFTRSYF